MTESKGTPASENSGDGTGGERSIIDRNEAGQLPPDDPNVAAGTGDYDHEKHIGAETGDDHGVGEALARLKSGDA